MRRVSVGFQILHGGIYEVRVWNSRSCIQGSMRRVSVGFQILHPGISEVSDCEIYEVSECGIPDSTSRDL